MIIELSSIDIGSRPFELSFPAEEINLELDNAKLIGKVDAVGEVIKSIAQTDVRGRIAATAELECVRCLQPVEKTIDIEFEVSYVDREYFSVDKEKEVSGDDLATDVLEGESIDLKDVVREQVLLDLPIQVFCGEDCKGLCQKCGVNLNAASCDCHEDGIDPRWSALKNLK